MNNDTCVNDTSLAAQQRQRTSNVRRQIIYSFWIKALSVLLSLVLVPLLIDTLSAQRYAIWLTLASIFSWFSFFDMGLGNGLRNKLTEAVAGGNQRLAKEYISTAYGVIALIFSVLMVLFWVGNPYIDWQVILNVQSIDNEELRLLTGVVFSLVLMRFIFQLVGVVYVAMQEPAVNNAIAAVGNLLAFICILCAYWAGSRNLLLYSALLVGMPLLVLLVCTYFAFGRTYAYLSPSLSAMSMRHVKSLLNLGALFFVIQISAIVLFSSANLLIVQEFDPKEVVVYSATLTYFQLPVVAYGIVMTPIWSAVTEAYARQDFNWLKSSLIKLNKISAVFVVGILVQALVSPIVYNVWLGNRVSIPFILSAAMALFAIINVVLAPYTSFINGTGKIRLTAVIALISLAVYFPLAIHLARNLESSAGIILATCLVNGIGLYFQPKQVSKILNGDAAGIWGK